jgi:F420-0:gamma-glutamyl ligase-like protein
MDWISDLKCSSSSNNYILFCSVLFYLFITIIVANADLSITVARRVIKSFALTAKRGRSLLGLVGYVLIATRRRKKMLVPIASSLKVTWTMSISKSVLDARLLNIAVVLVKKTIGKSTVLYVTQQQQQ